MTAAAVRTMRAGVLSGPGAMTVREVPVPEPGPGQVRVRLEGSGVCGSNLPVLEGRPWFSYPLEPGAPGHEGWGVVDAAGPGVSSVRAGERVALLSGHAFADFDVADADAVVPIPDPIGGPCPAEALGCAANVVRRSGIRAGETVAVVGIGFIGAVVVRLAANAGARVIALSRRPFARETALRMGAAEAFPLEPHDDVVSRVRALGGDGVPCVVEAVGSQGALDLATALTAERGRLVVAGYHQDGDRRVDMQLWNWRGLDVINAHERDRAEYRRGMIEALDAVATGRLDPSPLYTHRIPLDRIGEAVELLRTRPDGFLKAVVTT